MQNPQKKKDKAYTHVQTAHSAAIIDKFTEKKSETRWSGVAAVKHVFASFKPAAASTDCGKNKKTLPTLLLIDKKTNFSDTSIITTVR